jgi:hypothetical protein
MTPGCVEVSVAELFAVLRSAGINDFEQRASHEQIEVAFVRTGYALCAISMAGGLSREQMLENVRSIWAQVQAETDTEGVA